MASAHLARPPARPRPPVQHCTTAFTGTAGKEAAMKIEQQLAYAERQKVGTRRAANPIVVREQPTKSNPSIRRWRRPRFTTSTVPR